MKPTNKKTYSNKGPAKIDKETIQSMFELLGLDTDGEILLEDDLLDIVPEEVEPKPSKQKRRKN